MAGNQGADANPMGTVLHGSDLLKAFEDIQFDGDKLVIHGDLEIEGHLEADTFDELLRIAKPGGLFVLSINSKFFIKAGFKKKFVKIKNIISTPLFKKFSAHGKNTNKTYNEVEIIACIFRKKS